MYVQQWTGENREKLFGPRYGTVCQLQQRVLFMGQGMQTEKVHVLEWHGIYGHGMSIKR